MKFCPHCGSPDTGNTYCTNCGQKKVQVQTFCNHSGKSLQKGSTAITILSLVIFFAAIVAALVFLQFFLTGTGDRFPSYGNESTIPPSLITTTVSSYSQNSPVNTDPVVVVITPADPLPTLQIIETPTPSQENLISRNYSWTYNGLQWDWSGTFSKAGFDYYRGKPHNRENNYAAYVLSDYDRQLLKGIVQKFKEAGEANNYTEYDTIMNIVSFVQSLPYTSDKVTTGYDEYPRYPLETLVDNGGDCEDTAILTAALLRELGFGVVLIQLPDHMAVGVKGDKTLQGTYYDYMGSRYYYLETTGSGWDIGELPDEYRNDGARVLPMVQLPRMDMDCKTEVTGFDQTFVYYRTHCDIENSGVGTTKNPRLYIAALALDKGNALIWKPDTTIILENYPEGSKGYAEASLKIPRNEISQIKCELYGDNFESSTSLSAIFST
jgi:predicted transglutaminase-like cysteine proteinase